MIEMKEYIWFKLMVVLLIFIIVWIFIWCYYVFLNKQNVRYQETDFNIYSGNVKNIICLWDSLTIWFGLDISQSYPMQLQNILKQNWYNYNIINAWKSGDTSDDLLKRFDWSISNYWKWDIVLLVIWWNDWLRWMDIDVMKSNIINIIDKLHEKWFIVVLWWMQIPLNYWFDYSNKFKNVYKYIADNKWVYSIDFFLDWVAMKPNLNQQDMMHPNQEWYSIISKKIYEFLVKNNIIKK